MIEATIRLLRDHSPDQITIRDVAEESGHHHRFVQAWFGGKVGLFRATFDRMLDDTAARIDRPLRRDTEFEPEVHATAVLMNWLVAAHPDALEAPRPTPILDRVMETYRTEFGLEPELARLMALRVVGASVAAMLFPGPLGIRPEDVGAIARLERELAGLLAASRSPSS